MQLSFFSATTAAPRPDDVAGLLAGPGQVVRLGRTARVSVVVGPGEHRVPALIAAFAARGLRAEPTGTVDGGRGVRTEYSAVLHPIAARWTRGAVTVPPPGFVLDGQQLRLWALAVGRCDERGYVLPLGASDERSWQPVGAALAGAGVPATLLTGRAGGPAYRVIGRRRLGRLRELVGDPPPDLDPGAWPTDPAG